MTLTDIMRDWKGGDTLHVAPDVWASLLASTQTLRRYVDDGPQAKDDALTVNVPTGAIRIQPNSMLEPGTVMRVPGLDIGRFLGNAIGAGSTYFREQRKARRLAFLDCRKCGAPLSPEDRPCEYCGTPR